MSKHTADQETRIAACFMVNCKGERCNSECRTTKSFDTSFHGNPTFQPDYWIECTICDYRANVFDQPDWAIAAHNVLATASARPKDVEGLRGELQDAKLLAKNRSETIERYVPEINQLHRQRDAYRKALQKAAQDLRGVAIKNEESGPDSFQWINDWIHEKANDIDAAIADCEATK